MLSCISEKFISFISSKFRYGKRLVDGNEWYAHWFSAWTRQPISMQSINSTELGDETLESRIPVSTLRSTASPYKHRTNQSLFNIYLSQLTSTSPPDFSVPSVSLSKEPFTFPCKSFTAASSTPPINASNASTDVSESSETIDTSLDLSLWSENAFDISASTPVPPSTSSPSSATADLSTFDLFQDEDDAATESDRPDSPLSPFSSPLSSAPSSPATTLITIIPPEGVLSTTTTTTRRLKQKVTRRSARSSDARDPPSDKGRSKRPRSPSPSPVTRHIRRPGSKANQVANLSHRKTPLSPRSLNLSNELVGPLIQVLALCGKSSMPTSTLVHEVLSATPSLRSEREVDEWMNLAIITMDSNAVFGRAEGKGLKVCTLPVVDAQAF